MLAKFEVAATPEAAEQSAVHQTAAAIADAAVRDAVSSALRAAHLCGCRGCRREAARTYEWAVGMLGLDGREDDR
jgi:hypothetical protein